jgi:tetratricopeptide (TPR) repeat protein
VRGDTSSPRLFLRADSLYGRASQLDPFWHLPIVRRGNIALLALAVRSPVPPRLSDSLQYRTLSVPERSRLWITRARELAEEALSRAPQDPSALLLRGQAALSLSGLEQARRDSLLVSAETDLRASLEQRPDFAVAWTALAELLQQRGQFADAAIAAQSAFDADAFFESRRVLAVALSASLAAEQFEDATRWCRLALAYYPGDVRFTECRLRILGSSASSRAAVSEGWEQVKQIEQRDSLHLLDATWGFRRLLVAAILARNRQHDSARAVVRTVRERQPDVAKAASDAAEAYVLLLLGDREAAIRALVEQARGLPPAHAASLIGHPWFKSLGDDPRIDSLLERRP